MTWLKEFIEELQVEDSKAKIPVVDSIEKQVEDSKAKIPVIDSIETQVEIFHEKLKQLQNKSHTVVNNTNLTVKAKESKIDLIDKETKILFVEALHFIFTHQENKNDATIFYYNKDEIETPLNLPFRGSLGNLLYYFTNVFNIDRIEGNALFNANINKHTKELNNISFSNYLKIFNVYYFTPSNGEKLKNHIVI